MFEHEKKSEPLLFVLSNDAKLIQSLNRELAPCASLSSGTEAELLEILKSKKIAVVLFDSSLDTQSVMKFLATQHPSIGRVLICCNKDEKVSPLVHYACVLENERLQETLQKAIEWYLLFEKHQNLSKTLPNGNGNGNGREKNATEEALRKSNGLLKRLISTDPLTGLGNRRLLSHQLQKELYRAQRYGRPLCLLFVDIDYFKRFNDRFGHDAGDELLCEIASRLSHLVRRVDIVVRYGGEEFVLALPETVEEHGLLLAERIRKQIAGHHFGKELGLSKGEITVSIGVASHPHDGKTISELIKSADRALYSAKSKGRNIVVASSP